MSVLSSGNSATRPQIAVSDVETVIDTHSTDLTGGTGVTTVSLVPDYAGGDGWWDNFASNVEATLALACEDAGYITLKGEFSAGTKTLVRIPCFWNDVEA